MGGRLLTDVLRWVLGTLGVVSLLAGVSAVAVGEAGSAVPFIVIAAVLVTVAAYEHTRYRALAGQGSEARWERTTEVFTDPTTGRRTRVWFDPRTGRRDYRDES